MRVVLALLFALIAGAAAAHDSRPLSVTVTEQEGGRFQIDWRTPPSVAEGDAPVVTLEGCEPAAPVAPALEGRALFDCSGRPGALAIAYQLYNPSLSTIVRMTWRSGEVSTTLLGPERTSLDLGAPATFGSVAKSYFALGVEHILIGIDHILFLVGLLILSRTPRRILETVTGFTLAHSATLALVALDVVAVSIPAVEATIALSIVFVAAEIARGDPESLAWRRPAIVASAFGLLHGAGFAAVLGEIGLPQTEKVAALLFFNVGVEAGQLLLVAAAFIAVALARTAMARLPGAPPFPAQTTRAAGYALGLVSAYWFVERTVAVFG